MYLQIATICINAAFINSAIRLDWNVLDVAFFFRLSRYPQLFIAALLLRQIDQQDPQQSFVQ